MPSLLFRLFIDRDVDQDDVRADLRVISATILLDSQLCPVQITPSIEFFSLVVLLLTFWKSHNQLKSLIADTLLGIATALACLGSNYYLICA